jgi:hypothetical protein
LRIKSNRPKYLDYLVIARPATSAVAIQPLDKVRGLGLACGEPAKPVEGLDRFVARAGSSQ